MRERLLRVSWCAPWRSGSPRIRGSDLIPATKLTREVPNTEFVDYESRVEVAMRYIRFEGHDPTQRSSGISMIQGRKASQFTRGPGAPPPRAKANGYYYLFM